MKRALIGLVVAAIWACTSSAQTTYTQTNRVCIPAECVDAQFIPTATLSYYIPGLSVGVPFSGEKVIWNNFTYMDFAGTYTLKCFRCGDPACPYPLACYELNGTFNNGHETVIEEWKCFRTCGPAQNTSGSVTAQ